METDYVNSFQVKHEYIDECFTIEENKTWQKSGEFGLLPVEEEPVPLNINGESDHSYAQIKKEKPDCDKRSPVNLNQRIEVNGENLAPEAKEVISGTNAKNALMPVKKLIVEMESLEQIREMLPAKDDNKETRKCGSLNVLPEKSKKMYEKCYVKFKRWAAVNGLTNVSEPALLVYFAHLGNRYQSSTLWSQFSMLRSAISTNENVDISQYQALKAFLTKKNAGYCPKQAEVLTSEQINQFLKDAPDQIHLLNKVIVIFGICGALRKSEIHEICCKDISDDGTCMKISIPGSKTYRVKSFVISGWFRSICCRYASLRPNNVKHGNFFVYFSNGRCTLQRVGMNKIAGVASAVAKFLKLDNPEKYTSHCLRRSAAAAGADFHAVERLGESMAYFAGADDNGIKISESISNENGVSTAVFQFVNCNNVTVNILK